MYVVLVPSGFAVLGLWGYVMATVFADAVAPQPGLEPDAFVRFAGSLGPAFKRVRYAPGRLIQHHGVKVLNTWRRWQGYKPLVLNRRTVWVPTHTILTPYETF